MKGDEIEPFYPYLGKMLADIRRARGMTQQQVGEALGLNATTITHYEKGGNRLRTLEFIQLCEVLTVDPAALLVRAREEAPELLGPRQCNSTAVKRASVPRQGRRV